MTLAEQDNASPLNIERYSALASIMAKASDLSRVFFTKRDTLTISEKSQRDFVSEADRAVEQEIINCIKSAFPDDDVVGEELGGRSGEKYWIIDPIDGTSNFLSGLPLWGISVAYVENGEPQFGAIAMPILGETVSGHIDLGLDQTSNAKRSNPAMPLVFGVGRNGLWNANKRIEAESQVEQLGYYPINLGSCSVALAYCALGRMAGYIEEGIGFWDCAAGVVLCRAAGLNVKFDVGTNLFKTKVRCLPVDLKWKD
ncbi:inositol monophosphatase family protein [Maritalea sp.]|uniref:inositol monophosphatase family protein n=1 Tax=Maritalea sp. TaxID=2003361 RepID=UPI003EF54C3A